MNRHARTTASVLALSALLACGPHRDPTEPAPPPAAKSRRIAGVLLASGEMHDDKLWFAPSHSRSLGAAAVPFARYLNQLHGKLHPHFANGLLAAINTLPEAHPLQEQSLAITVGLVIRGTDGHLVRRGVLRSSGLTAFDISALRAIDLAAPFGAAPSATLSPDGNVYVQWQLRRDQLACSTLHVRPYLLR
jgi:hypothetical protein